MWTRAGCAGPREREEGSQSSNRSVRLAYPRRTGIPVTPGRVAAFSSRVNTANLFQDDGALAAELGWVRGLATRLVADPNDAEDVAQEAWLKARSTPRGFASIQGLRAWLAAVTRSLARDMRRSELRRAGREERAARVEASAQDDVTQDVVERSETVEAVLAALRELEEPYRSTVLLRHMDGRSTADVAHLTRVSEEVVRKRLSRGHARLRRRLERRFGGEFRACLLELAGCEPAAGLALGAKLALAAGLAGVALVGARASLPAASIAVHGVETSAVEASAVELPDADQGRVALESAPLPDATRQPLVSAPCADESRSSATPALPGGARRGVRDYRYADDGRGNVQEVELELVPPLSVAADAPRSDQ